MLRSIGKVRVSPEEDKVRYGGKDFQKKGSFKLGVEEWRGNGWWSGELMKLMEEVTLKELGDAELERLVRGWRKEARSWFQRRREAYWKELSVIRREDDVDGRANVTKDEDRVLRGGELW